MKRVLILGGGFAGVEAAIEATKAGYEVDLVSPRSYMYIYPISIWVPFEKADFDSLCISMEELASVYGFNWISDEIVSIDAKKASATGKKGEYGGDYIIVAFGASKLESVKKENFLSICSEPGEILKIKEAIKKLIEKGEGKIAIGFGGNPKDTTAVRGGPAFEFVFNLHNYLKKLGIRDRFELTFFAPMKEPGKRLGPQALKMMDMFFNRLHIKRVFGKKIKSFEPEGVLFEDDRLLESDFTMFIPALTGHRAAKNGDLPLSDSGFILVDKWCRVQGYENIYAAGDCAYLDGPAWRAKQGHIAEVMAKNAVHNIAVFSGEKRGKPKSYLEHLNIMCVMDSGDGAAFVYRDDKRGVMVPMPVVGHWLKKGWGWYCKNSKLNKIPRIPGL